MADWRLSLVYAADGDTGSFVPFDPQAPVSHVWEKREKVDSDWTIHGNDATRIPVVSNGDTVIVRVGTPTAKNAGWVHNYVLVTPRIAGQTVASPFKTDQGMQSMVHHHEGKPTPPSEKSDHGWLELELGTVAAPKGLGDLAFEIALGTEIRIADAVYHAAHDPEMVVDDSGGS